MEVLRTDLSPFVRTDRSCKDNLALRLDKLNLAIDEPDFHEHSAKDAALDVMAAFTFSEAAKTAYSRSYNEWREVMRDKKDVECFEIRSTTKVLLGTGNSSIYEFGFNLSVPYGVPYISGSTLKGLVSSYLARRGGEEWRRSATGSVKSALQVQLFGGGYDGSDYVGSVNFFDARLSPKENNWFVKDVVTTHHQKYYGDGTDSRLPDGTENPIPVNIVALRPGLKFFVALQGPEKDRRFIKKVLLEALTNEGVGGKTAVGYGRFAYVEGEEEKLEKLKSLSNQELSALNTGRKLGDNVDFDSAIRFALERNEISADLKTKYKKYTPFRYIRLLIDEGEIDSIDALNKIRKELKNNLRKYPDPKRSADAQFVFDYALKNFGLTTALIQENSFLSSIAYDWNDVINEDNVEDVVLDAENRVWPPASSLREFIKNSDFKNKNELLELLR